MPRVYYQEATLDIVDMTNSLLDSGCCSTMIKSLPPPRLKSSTPTRISYFTIYDYLLLLCSSSVALPQHASIANREAPIFFPPLLALAGRRSWHRNSTTWVLLEFHFGRASTLSVSDCIFLIRQAVGIPGQNGHPRHSLVIPRIDCSSFLMIDSTK